MQHPHKHRRRRVLLAAVTGAAALIAAGLTALSPTTAEAATAIPHSRLRSSGGTPMVEKLDCGVVSVHTDSGNLVGWRWRGTDPDDVSFNVYRAGTKVNSTPITGSTNFFHTGAPAQADYTVRAIVGGVEQADSVHAIQFRTGYKDVPITPPAGGTTPDGVRTPTRRTTPPWVTWTATAGSTSSSSGSRRTPRTTPSRAIRVTRSSTASSSTAPGCGASTSGATSASGAHYTQFQVYDYDGDGKDEIVYGSMAADDDGSGLWTTKNGHGDAMHVGDLDPSRPGLEEFKVDEDGSKPASWMADAKTGRIIWSTPANGDNGRGVCGDIWAGSAGAESWSSHADGVRDPKGNVVASRKPSSINFLSWWDGDTVRELLDDTHIDKYGTSSDTRLLTGSGVHSNNSTKATPSLSGDILGDWREEVVWPTSDNTALRIYSTPYETSTKITTLLHDTQYRTALAWQNTAYNQPPHPSFFIGDGMATPPRPTVHTP